MIQNQGVDSVWQHEGVQCCTREPWKVLSFLFNHLFPWNLIAWRWGQVVGKAPVCPKCLVYSPVPLENWRRGALTPPIVPITASGLQGWQPLAHRRQVGRVGRQSGSVTLGKGLALGVGYGVLCFDCRAEQELVNASWLLVDFATVWLARQRETVLDFPCVESNQPRTRVDNGNLTV
jgi:hypothetical protein